MVDAHFDLGIEAGEAVDFVARLEDEFLAMGEDHGAAWLHAANDFGEEDGLAAAGRHDDEGGLVFFPVVEEAVGRLGLVVAKGGHCV